MVEKKERVKSKAPGAPARVQILINVDHILSPRYTPQGLNSSSSSFASTPVLSRCTLSQHCCAFPTFRHHSVVPSSHTVVAASNQDSRTRSTQKALWPRCRSPSSSPRKGSRSHEPRFPGFRCQNLLRAVNNDLFSPCAFEARKRAAHRNTGT